MEPGRDLYKVLMTNDDCFQLNMINFLMFKAMDNCIIPSYAKNGHEALMHVQANLNELSKATRRLRDSNSRSSQNVSGHYCGIILDLDMPIMGGLEACERILNAYKDFENLSQGNVIPFITTTRRRIGTNGTTLQTSGSMRDVFAMGTRLEQVAPEAPEIKSTRNAIS